MLSKASEGKRKVCEAFILSEAKLRILFFPLPKPPSLRIQAAHSILVSFLRKLVSLQKKRNEHVCFLGCCLVFLLGKNKRRRDTKLRKTVIIFSFVCSARDNGFEGCAEKKKRARIFSWFYEEGIPNLGKQLLSFLLYAQLVSLIPCLLCPLIEDKDHKKHRTLFSHTKTNSFIFEACIPPSLRIQAAHRIPNKR